MEELSQSIKATLNNKTYYLLADFNGNVTRGWVPADQVTIAQSTPTKVKKQYNVKGNANIYYVPWSKDNQVVAKTPKMAVSLIQLTN